MSDERYMGRTIQQHSINSILRAGGAIRRRLARLMSGHGLTPSQYHVTR